MVLPSKICLKLRFRADFLAVQGELASGNFATSAFARFARACITATPNPSRLSTPPASVYIRHYQNDITNYFCWPRAHVSSSGPVVNVPLSLLEESLLSGSEASTTRLLSIDGFDICNL